MLVRLVPIGEAETKIISAISSELSGLYSIRVKLLPKIELSRSAFNLWRRQYDAERLLENLGKSGGMHIDHAIPCIGITEEDIYFDGLNFVFALEDVVEGVGIVSLHRLREEFYGLAPDFGKLVERAVKEILHVLGHLFGLEHCKNPSCIMAFSPSVSDIDKKELAFCKSCQFKLAAMGINFE